MQLPLRGLLIDVDGVLRIGAEPISGAGETLEWLRSHNIPFRLLTNVTRQSRREEAERLTTIGIVVSPSEIFTASAVAAEYLRRQRNSRCWVLLEGSAREDFFGLELTDRVPDFVVVGDVGDTAPVELFHRAFRALLAGARLIAIQRNRAWTGNDGLPRLDVGAWVAALEYASGQHAMVMGKPAEFAYRLAAEDLGIPLTELAMVADDPEVDLAGALAVGMQTILVDTTSLPQRRPAQEGEFDYGIPSIANVPRLFQGLSKEIGTTSTTRTRHTP